MGLDLVEREEVREREVEGRAVPLVPVLRFMFESSQFKTNYFAEM